MRLSIKVPVGYEKLFAELTPIQKVQVKEAMSDGVKRVIDKLNEAKK